MTDTTYCELCNSHQYGPTIECSFAAFGCGNSFHLSCLEITAEESLLLDGWTCGLCTLLKTDPAQRLPGGLFGESVSAGADMLQGVSSTDLEGFDELPEMSEEEFEQGLEAHAESFHELERDFEAAGGWDAVSAKTGYRSDVDAWLNSDKALDGANIDATIDMDPPGLRELFEAHVHEMEFDYSFMYETEQEQ